jgi:tetratricopeptide (TPR) repeat protein
MPKPLDAKSLIARADELSANGNPERAIADYDAALRIDPASVEALHGRAKAWRFKGDRRRALADLDAAIRIRPDFESARADRRDLFREIERAGAQMPLTAPGAIPK